MKKKILALIIAVFLITPCFMINAEAIITERADNSTVCGISLSDDYKTLYYNGSQYKRIDASMTEWDQGDTFYDIYYNSDEIKYVDFFIGTNNAIIWASITLNDGSCISSTYINTEGYLAEHNSLTNNASEYTVEFMYPADSQVKLTSNQILGEQTTLLGEDLEFYEEFYVNAYSTDSSFYIKKGVMLVIDDTYYYVDYGENNLTSFYRSDPQPQSSLYAYKITDTEAIALLEKAYSLYNSDAIGFLTGDFSENIGVIFLFLTFGLIPLVALVLFLILDLRAKLSAYKKMFRIIWIISAAEIVAFVITVILL